MRKLFFLIALIWAGNASAQVLQYDPGYGRQFRRVVFDSVLTVPKDTGSRRTSTAVYDTGQVRYVKSDSSLYVWAGSAWVKQRGAGGSGTNYWTQGAQGIYTNQAVSVGAVTDSTHKFDVDGDSRLGHDTSDHVSFGNGLIADMNGAIGPRIYSTDPLKIQSNATNGTRVIVGTQGGNTAGWTNEAEITMGDASGTAGKKRGLIITGRILTASGNQDYSFIEDSVVINQTGGTGDINFIKYNPTISALSGNHFFLNSGKGRVKLGGVDVIATDTTNYKLLVIDSSGNVRKFPNWAGIGAGGGGAVTSFASRTGDIAPDGSDYAAFYPNFGNSYSDPSWIFSLSWSKIINRATTLSGYGINDAMAASDTGRGNTNKVTGWSLNKVRDSLQANVALKVNIADTATMLTPYLRKIDTTAMLLPYLRKTDTTAMLSPYLRKIDTTVFARKSMPAYSFRANNTSGVADATAFTFRSVGAQSIAAGVPVWTAGTAPSGAESHQYTWTQVGKLVTMSFYLTYVTAGATCTAVRFPLPSDMPAPLELAGTGAADEFLYIGSGYIGTAKTTTPAVMSRVTIEVNSGDTGWDVFTTGTSVSGRVCYGTITYTAQ